jgi:membrane protease YdiL (CAAX protease family)
VIERTTGDAGEERFVARRLSAVTVLAIGIAVTAVAAVESWRGWPYAPFPIIHACLAIIVPLWFYGWPAGRPWPEIRSLLPRQIAPIIAAILFIGCYLLIYAWLLAVFRETANPAWNLISTYREYGALLIPRYGSRNLLIAGYIFLGLWPMFGEELFYRGFDLRGLLGSMSPIKAAVMTSALFGMRHAAQLTYLLPTYPWGAGLAYFVWAFGLSMIWCWVYIRTESLWLCIASHGLNIFLAPFVLAVIHW